jgi:hypothetical protein
VFAVFPHISSAEKHWFSGKVLDIQDDMALLIDCILKRALTPRWTFVGSAPAVLMS